MGGLLSPVKLLMHCGSFCEIVDLSGTVPYPAVVLSSVFDTVIALNVCVKMS